ncbi:MAG: GumC family protein [Cypionkella sp.]
MRDADLDLTMIVRLIRRRIRFIGILTVVLTLLVLPFIMMLKSVYRAEARFLIQQPISPDPTGAKTAFNLDDEVQRVSARAIADRIVAQFDLAQRPEFNPDLQPVSAMAKLVAAAKTSISGTAAALPAPKTDPAERVLAAFYDRLSVGRQTDSIMQIGFKSTDPELAADVPNAMIDAYIADRKAFHESRIQEALTLVNARIAAQQSVVDKAAETVSAFQKQNGVTSAGHVVDLQTNQLVLLNAQQADLHKRRVELQSKIASVDAALSGSGAVPMNETDTLVQLRQNLQQEQNELTRLSSRFGDGFAGVQTQRTRIASLEGAIQRELKAWGLSMRAQLAQLDTEEAQLAANDVAAQGTLSKTSIAELQLSDLVRRAGVQTQILEGIEAEKSQLEGLRNLAVFDLELLTPATLPLWPEGHGRKIYLVLAIFASGFIALTLAGILELTDRTLRSHQQLLGEPGLLPVGMLPVSGKRNSTHVLGQARYQPGSRLKEALRGVLLAMENENGGVQPISLMITTARPHEGASFVANELAHELLESGRNVLIVDALTPKSRFWQRRNPPVQPGLAEYLRREAPLSELVADTDYKGLHVLHRGNGPLTHLHDAERIEHILDYGSAFGQLVIFICPPVLNNTSVLRIAAVVHRVMLVIDWGVTPRESVLLTAQRLRAGHVDRVLTLLNRVQPKRHALYSYRDAAAFSGQSSVSGW